MLLSRLHLKVSNSYHVLPEKLKNRKNVNVNKHLLTGD